jgi:hypothetical protein
MKKFPYLAGLVALVLTSVVGADALVISNDAPATVTSSAATFTATLQVPSTNADVFVYWGPADGTTNTAAWSNALFVGTWSNVVSVPVSVRADGLSAASLYFYTFRSTNTSADIWAEPSTNFVTAGPDTLPMVNAFSPSNGAAEVDPDTDLMLTFDKTVVITNAGSITITNLTDATGVEIPIDDAQISVTGAVLTVNLLVNLEIGDTYAVLIDGSALQNTNGNSFAGVTNTTTWRFTVTADPNWALVAYWPLNDGVDGQTISATGGADDVIDDPDHPATDAVAQGTAGRWVYNGTRGIVFSTTEDDRLNAGTMGITGDFTWSVWIKTTDTSVFMGTRSGSYFRLGATSVSSGGYVNWDFSPDANDDRWHHMVLRRANDLWTVWIDGVQASGSDTQSAPNNSPLELGGSSRFSEDYTGLMSEAAVWDDALTQTRIQDLAAGGDVIIDTVPPSIAALNPTNTATAVPVGENMIARFDKNIITNAGNVVVTNLSNGTGFVIPMGDSQVTVAGAALTINPVANLEQFAMVAVRIDSGVVANTAGYRFGGITNDTTWTFTTGGGDVTVPTLWGLSPTNNSDDASSFGNLVATFDENVLLVNGGVITLTNLTAGTSRRLTIPDAQVFVLHTNLIIDPALDLSPGDTYAVLIDATALEDSSGNPFVGILDSATWRFVVNEQIVVNTLEPLNGVTEVLTRSNLVATFSEDITLLDGGLITVSNVTDGTAIAITFPDAQVTANGAQLIIDLTSNLHRDTQYAVLIDASAVADPGALNFAGITNAATWTFTTTVDPNANLVAYWPLNDGAHGQTITAAADIIDDPAHPAVDAIAQGTGGTWFKDPVRGIVFSTTEDDRLNAGSMGITGDFTWSVWVKTVDASVFMGTRSGSYVRLGATTVSGSWVSFDYAPDVNDDVWHHVVLRRLGDTVSVWVDGVFGGSKARSGSNNPPLELGGSSMYSEDYTGLMSQAAIWDEALSSERIQQLAAGFPILPLAPPNAFVLIVR